MSWLEIGPGLNKSRNQAWERQTGWKSQLSMAKNYYLILGIAEDASREDIRAAFRRRALELHPDRSGMERGPFQEVQEAYNVLSDPERRGR